MIPPKAALRKIESRHKKVTDEVFFIGWDHDIGWYAANYDHECVQLPASSRYEAYIHAACWYYRCELPFRLPNPDEVEFPEMG